jgi:hypothetical protein
MFHLHHQLNHVCFIIIIIIIISGACDHYTQKDSEDGCGEVTDLWDTDKPAFGMNGTYGDFMQVPPPPNTHTHTHTHTHRSEACTRVLFTHAHRLCSSLLTATLMATNVMVWLIRYAGRAVDTIQAHDPSVPLFYYLALQCAHDPMEVSACFTTSLLFRYLTLVLQHPSSVRARPDGGE